MFRKYQHIERLGTTSVEGIELGDCYVFPKIDGTNGSIWIEDGVIKVGSRNREIDTHNDNAGFCKWVLEQDNIKKFFEDNPSVRLYGEWLVPHSLKTYREDAWRNFYVFDVAIDINNDDVQYLSYDEYKSTLGCYGIDYIVPLAKIKNPTKDQLYEFLDKNIYLIKDGEGSGEGIVIKNYKFKNQFGKTVWAKLVRSEFKDIHTKEMGCVEIAGRKMLEEEIVNKYCNETFIRKEFEKIKVSDGGWNSKLIPKLLQTIFYTLIKEECWNFIKENKNPTIDFKLMNTLVIKKVKEVLTEIF